MADAAMQSDEPGASIRVEGTGDPSVLRFDVEGATVNLEEIVRPFAVLPNNVENAQRITRLGKQFLVRVPDLLPAGPASAHLLDQLFDAVPNDASMLELHDALEAMRPVLSLFYARNWYRILAMDQGVLEKCQRLLDRSVPLLVALEAAVMDMDAANQQRLLALAVWTRSLSNFVPQILGYLSKAPNVDAVFSSIHVTQLDQLRQLCSENEFLVPMYAHLPGARHSPTFDYDGAWETQDQRRVDMDAAFVGNSTPRAQLKRIQMQCALSVVETACNIAHALDVILVAAAGRHAATQLTRATKEERVVWLTQFIPPEALAHKTAMWTRVGNRSQYVPLFDAVGQASQHEGEWREECETPVRLPTEKEWRAAKIGAGFYASRLLGHVQKTRNQAAAATPVPAFWINFVARAMQHDYLNDAMASIVYPAISHLVWVDVVEQKATPGDTMDTVHAELAKELEAATTLYPQLKHSPLLAPTSDVDYEPGGVGGSDAATPRRSKRLRTAKAIDDVGGSGGGSGGEDNHIPLVQPSGFAAQADIPVATYYSDTAKEERARLDAKVTAYLSALSPTKYKEPVEELAAVWTEANNPRTSLDGESVRLWLTWQQTWHLCRIVRDMCMDTDTTSAGDAHLNGAVLFDMMNEAIHHIIAPPHAEEFVEQAIVEEQVAMATAVNNLGNLVHTDGDVLRAIAALETNWESLFRTGNGLRQPERILHGQHLFRRARETTAICLAVLECCQYILLAEFKTKNAAGVAALAAAALAANLPPPMRQQAVSAHDILNKVTKLAETHNLTTGFAALRPWQKRWHGRLENGQPIPLDQPIEDSPRGHMLFCAERLFRRLKTAPIQVGVAGNNQLIAELTGDTSLADYTPLISDGSIYQQQPHFFGVTLDGEFKRWWPAAAIVLRAHERMPGAAIRAVLLPAIMRDRGARASHISVLTRVANVYSFAQKVAYYSSILASLAGGVHHVARYLWSGERSILHMVPALASFTMETSHYFGQDGGAAADQTLGAYFKTRVTAFFSHYPQDKQFANIAENKIASFHFDKTGAYSERDWFPYVATDILANTGLDVSQPVFHTTSFLYKHCFERFAFMSTLDLTPEALSRRAVSQILPYLPEAIFATQPSAVQWLSRISFLGLGLGVGPYGIYASVRCYWAQFKTAATTSAEVEQRMLDQMRYGATSRQAAATSYLSIVQPALLAAASEMLVKSAATLPPLLAALAKIGWDWPQYTVAISGTAFVLALPILLATSTGRTMLGATIKFAGRHIGKLVLLALAGVTGTVFAVGSYIGGLVGGIVNTGPGALVAGGLVAADQLGLVDVKAHAMAWSLAGLKYLISTGASAIASWAWRFFPTGSVATLMTHIGYAALLAMATVIGVGAALWYAKPLYAKVDTYLADAYPRHWPMLSPYISTSVAFAATSVIHSAVDAL